MQLLLFHAHKSLPVKWACKLGRVLRVSRIMDLLRPYSTGTSSNGGKLWQCTLPLSQRPCIAFQTSNLFSLHVPMHIARSRTLLSSQAT